MTKKHPPKTVYIIGAGFAGLTTAYYLAKSGFSVKIYEKDSHAGGKVGTRSTPCGLTEIGPNGIMSNHLLETLCEDLKISLHPMNNQFRKRYIYRKGHPRTWPLTIFETLRLIQGASRLFLFKDASYFPQPEESVYDWGSRVFGDSFTTDIMQTVLQGVYADKCKDQSAELIFPPRRFLGGSKKEKSVTVSFSSGMGELIDELRLKITNLGGEFYLNKKIDENMIEEMIAEKNPIAIATSIKEAGKLLSSVSPELSEAFLKVPMLPLTTVTGFWSLHPEGLRGFGCLFPRSTQVQALGVLFNSDIFAKRASENIRSETWIYSDKDLLEKTNTQVLEQIKKDRAEILDKDNPLEFHIKHWPEALPRYGKDLQKALEKKKNRLPHHIYLNGNYLGRIGLSQILQQSFEISKNIAQKHNIEETFSNET